MLYSQNPTPCASYSLASSPPPRCCLALPRSQLWEGLPASTATGERPGTAVSSCSQPRRWTCSVPGGSVKGNAIRGHPPTATTSGHLGPQECYLLVEMAEPTPMLGLGSHLPPPGRQSGFPLSTLHACVGGSRQAEERNAALSQATWGQSASRHAARVQGPGNTTAGTRAWGAGSLAACLSCSPLSLGLAFPTCPVEMNLSSALPPSMDTKCVLPTK